MGFAREWRGDSEKEERNLRIEIQGGIRDERNSEDPRRCGRARIGEQQFRWADILVEHDARRPAIQFHGQQVDQHFVPSVSGLRRATLCEPLFESPQQAQQLAPVQSLHQLPGATVGAAPALHFHEMQFTVPAGQDVQFALVPAPVITVQHAEAPAAQPADGMALSRGAEGAMRNSPRPSARLVRTSAPGTSFAHTGRIVPPGGRFPPSHLPGHYGVGTYAELDGCKLPRQTSRARRPGNCARETGFPCPSRQWPPPASCNRRLRQVPAPPGCPLSSAGSGLPGRG